MNRNVRQGCRRQLRKDVSWRQPLRFVALMIVPLVLAPAEASAQTLAAGWEGGASKGSLFALPAFSLETMGRPDMVVRGSLNYLFYQYPAGTDMVHVSSPGAWLGTAVRVRRNRFNATFGPGLEIRRTVRRAGERLIGREIERGVALQAEAFGQLSTRSMVSLLSNYGFANRYVWVRSGLRRQLSSANADPTLGVALLAEATIQGNQDQHAVQGGGGVEIHVHPLASALQFRAGASREAAGHAVRWRPYFGVGLYREF